VRSDACPCGSGVPRRECDPAELSLCLWPDCAAVFHRHNNRQRYCPPHGLEAKRASKRRTNERRRRAGREAREAAAIAAAAAKRERLPSSPDQTTLDVTL
jgi:hypothetical protein